MAVRSYCDEIGPVVRGWALDELQPGKPVAVTITINGSKHLTAESNLHREDLRGHFSSLDHGFELDISESLQNGLNSVTVTLTDSGELLPYGQREFIYENEQERCLVGKDGWLFLDNDSNDVLAQLRGDRQIEATTLRRLGKQIFFRKIFAERLGSRLIQTVIPEKPVIYREFLPSEFALSETRPAITIGKYLAGVGLEDLWYYHPETLLKAKSAELVYFKTDTHLTDDGSLLVLEDLSRHFGLDLADRSSMNRVESTPINGDLGSKLRSPVREDSFKLATTPPLVELQNSVSKAFEQGLTRTGTSAIYRNSDPKHANKTALIFGTSTGYNLCHIVASAFEHVVFCWSNHWDMRVIEALRPTVILNILTERVIPTASWILNSRCRMELIFPIL